jgi:hypothetical protein
MNVTFTFLFFYYSSTCFVLTRPSSGVIVYFTEAGALLCQFFSMPVCRPCAPADGVLIVSVRVLEYLCCLCGRHVTCLLLLLLLLLLAHGWHPGIEKKWLNRAPASVKYTITPEDGRVRPKHVDE